MRMIRLPSPYHLLRYFPLAGKFVVFGMVHLDDTFLSDVSGYAPWCGWFTSNQSTSAHIVPLELADSAEGLTAFTVISGPPDLSLTVSPVCICALSAMLHSSVLGRWRQLFHDTLLTL